MKKTLLLIITISLLQVNQQVLKAQYTHVWDQVTTLPNEWLQKISTQGLDTVFVVGRNGLIAKSTDRAATWAKQYPVTAQLNDIIFCNHTTGFAVGNNGTILKTTDAGASWTQQSSGVTVNLNAIAATGADNIWAVGDSGKVIFSTNAGVTWQKKDFSISVNLNDISFRNNIGYIVGNAHTCFISTDDGNNWTIKDIAVQNPYNLPVAIFDLLSINQTENHTYTLIGNNQYGTRGTSINIDNNEFVRPLPTISSFMMKNDSIGYGFWGDCTTGSSGCFISVQYINFNNIDPTSTSGWELHSYYGFDINHSDINFANDTIGYIASGNLLFHTKRYVEIIKDGLSITSNNKLSITNTANELSIQFEENKIYQIELYSITGLKILSENVSSGVTSKSINTMALSNGIYIIRTCNSDNTYSNIKWIKQ